MSQEPIRTLSDIVVTINYVRETDATVSDEEVQAYIDRAYQQHPTQVLKTLKLDVEGDEVGIHYGFDAVPFDRIRRITGYLVGTMDRWNDAKTHEEAQRVKHSTSTNDRIPTCSTGC